MKLIVDSGSTITDWSIVSSTNIQTVQTNGLNPFFTSAGKLEKEIKHQTLLWKYQDQIRDIHFYGAGCGTEKNDALIRKALQRMFSKAKISVYTDLLGAARGLFHHEEGIVCILGTGSNSGYFDGQQITRKIPALGYILGDEGSGNHLGKKLLKSYFFYHLPGDLKEKFNKKYDAESRGLLQKLYMAEFPNIHLSEYSNFIIEHQNHPYIKDMTSETFEEFLQMLKSYYSPSHLQKPMKFTGSIAWFLKDILQSKASEMKINVDKIEQSPMKGLINFHTKLKL